MTWSVQVRATYIHLNWWKPTWDFPPQLQPTGDWLVCQAEAVCTKTVYLRSYPICVYSIATLGISDISYRNKIKKFVLDRCREWVSTDMLGPNTFPRSVKKAHSYHMWGEGHGNVLSPQFLLCCRLFQWSSKKCPVFLLLVGSFETMECVKCFWKGNCMKCPDLQKLHAYCFKGAQNRKSYRTISCLPSLCP